MWILGLHEYLIWVRTPWWRSLWITGSLWLSHLSRDSLVEISVNPWVFSSSHVLCTCSMQGEKEHSRPPLLWTNIYLSSDGYAVAKWLPRRLSRDRTPMTPLLKSHEPNNLYFGSVFVSYGFEYNLQSEYGSGSSLFLYPDLNLFKNNFCLITTSEFFKTIVDWKSTIVPVP